MQASEHSNIYIQTQPYYDSYDSIQDTVTSAAHKIITTLLLLAGYQGPVTARLWDSGRFKSGEDTLCVLHMQHPDVNIYITSKDDVIFVVMSDTTLIESDCSRA